MRLTILISVVQNRIEIHNSNQIIFIDLSIMNY